jgi:hypothetical protein
MKTIQYTIRGIPERVNEVVRRRATATKKSMNEVLLDALSKGLGVAEEPAEYHDLDDLAGTWIEDPEFDAAIKAFDSIDKDLWK